ncbi:MAG: hypothetical protein ACRD2E_04080 [Terriglobales bacterium]
MPPIPSSAGEAGRRVLPWARGTTHRVATGLRQFGERMEGWKSEGREWLRLGRRFLHQVRDPQGRQRHMVTLLALAAGAGLVVGLWTGRRRED